MTRLFSSILICALFAEVLYAEQSRVSNKNSSLTVNAGPAQTVTLPAPAMLAGSVVALPKRSSAVSTWTVTSGPGAVNFANPAAASTSAAFSSAGTYVLTLTATSSTKLTTRSSVTITVNPAVIVTLPPPAPVVAANKLAWDAVSGADGYNLYRTDGGCDDLSTFRKANAQLITAIPYSDDPTGAGAWCYFVRAVNSAGEGAASDVIWVPTK